MPKRELGDIYEVTLDPESRGCFQHVAYDRTQLNASVIRVFVARNVNDIATMPFAKVAFHVHVGLILGERLNVWRKVGRGPVSTPVDPCFRMCDDYGDPSVKTSHKWNVWAIDGPMKSVGTLNAQTRRCEIGLIVNPLSVIHRMRTGHYDFEIPG